jgi:hypothetical protein
MIRPQLTGSRIESPVARAAVSMDEVFDPPRTPRPPERVCASPEPPGPCSLRSRSARGAAAPTGNPLALHLHGDASMAALRKRVRESARNAGVRVGGGAWPLLRRPGEKRKPRDDCDENQRNQNAKHHPQKHKGTCRKEQRGQDELSISSQICHGALGPTFELTRRDAGHRVCTGTALKDVGGDPVLPTVASNTGAAPWAVAHWSQLSCVVEDEDGARLRSGPGHGREYPSFEGLARRSCGDSRRGVVTPPSPRRANLQHDRGFQGGVLLEHVALKPAQRGRALPRRGNVRTRGVRQGGRAWGKEQSSQLHLRNIGPASELRLTWRRSIGGSSFHSWRA